MSPFPVNSEYGEGLESGIESESGLSPGFRYSKPLIIVPLTYTLNRAVLHPLVLIKVLSNWTCHPYGESSQLGLVIVEILS